MGRWNQLLEDKHTTSARHHYASVGAKLQAAVDARSWWQKQRFNTILLATKFRRPSSTFYDTLFRTYVLPSEWGVCFRILICSLQRGDFCDNYWLVMSFNHPRLALPPWYQQYLTLEWKRVHHRLLLVVESRSSASPWCPDNAEAQRVKYDDLTTHNLSIQLVATSKITFPAWVSYDFLGS